MYGQPIDIFYNVTTMQLLSAADAGYPISDNGLSRIYYGGQYVLRITLLQGASDTLTPWTGFGNSGLTFLAGVDNDWAPGTAPICYTANLGINQTADWAEASAGAGKFAVQLNCATTQFLTKVGTTAEISNSMFELQAWNGGYLFGVIRFSIRPFNLLLSDSVIPTSVLDGINFRFKQSSTGPVFQLKDQVNNMFYPLVMANGMLGRGEGEV